MMITFVCKLSGSSKRSDDGLRLALATHPHDTPAEIRDLQLGQYLKLTVELVDENELTLEWPKRGRPRETPGAL